MWGLHLIFWLALMPFLLGVFFLACVLVLTLMLGDLVHFV